MEVGFAIRHLKSNFDGRIEALNFLSEVIRRRVEREAIGAGAKSFVLGQQFWAAAILVGLRDGKHAPLSARILPFEAHGYVLSGLAERDVEDVGGYAGHEESHFLSRRCAIWRCCSAASRSSVVSSF